MSAAEHARATVAEAMARGDALWRASEAERAAWLGHAFGLLRDPASELGQRARRELPLSTGLSPAMVGWALDAALSGLDPATLTQLVARIPAPHAAAVRTRAGQLCAVVLAGNVFTAVVRAALWPLLLGLPVVAKASSHDAAFPRLLEAALAHGELGGAFRVLAFSAEDGRATDVLLAQADALSVFGSDQTVSALRARIGASVAFQGHGHGLGAAFVARAALDDTSMAAAVAAAFARDVAAYDQRGCMSPHTLWVERGAAVSPAELAEHVHGALGALEAELPRGPLPFEVAAQQLSYRGIGAVRGTLHEGTAHAVAHDDGDALRLSPGYRNVQVLAIDGVDALVHRLAALGVHLKCLGVAGITPRSLLAVLPARLAPRLCALGSMQCPPPDALADGVPAWEGLVRYAELV